MLPEHRDAIELGAFPCVILEAIHALDKRSGNETIYNPPTYISFSLYMYFVKDMYGGVRCTLNSFMPSSLLVSLFFAVLLSQHLFTFLFL